MAINRLLDENKRNYKSVFEKTQSYFDKITFSLPFGCQNSLLKTERIGICVSAAVLVCVEIYKY